MTIAEQEILTFPYSILVSKGKLFTNRNIYCLIMFLSLSTGLYGGDQTHLLFKFRSTS